MTGWKEYGRSTLGYQHNRKLAVLMKNVMALDVSTETIGHSGERAHLTLHLTPYLTDKAVTLATALSTAI